MVGQFRREALAIMLVVAFLGAAVVGAWRGWYQYPPRSSFGPDWDCTPNPYADVCVKRVPPAPARP